MDFSFIFSAGCSEADAIRMAGTVVGLSLDTDGFYKRRDAAGNIYVLPVRQADSFSHINDFLAKASFSKAISKDERHEYYRLGQIFREAEKAWRHTSDVNPSEPGYA